MNKEDLCNDHILILDSQLSCKNNTEGSHVTLSQLALMITYYMITVHFQVQEPDIGIIVNY